MTVLLAFLIAAALIYCAGGLYFLTGLFRKNTDFSGAYPFVSVVIAARNEAENIRRCLVSAASQTYPAGRYEIILVDDQSDDDTALIAREMAETHPHISTFSLTYIPEGFSPKKYALQEGISRSRGDIIITTDADCVVPPTWIEGMVRHFTDDVGMVAGVSVIEPTQARLSLLHGIQTIDFLSLLSAAAGSIAMGKALAVTGQNLSYRRVAYDAVGGFSQIKHRVSGDDVLLLQLIRNQTDWKIGFAHPETTKVQTSPQATWGAFIRQRVRWASNSDIQRHLNPMLFFYLFSVFLLSAGLLFFIPAAFLSSTAGTVPFVCLTAKFCIDCAVIGRGMVFFRVPLKNLILIIPWFILHPFILVISGTGGLLRKISWKGREFAK